MSATKNSVSHFIIPWFNYPASELNRGGFYGIYLEKNVTLILLKKKIKCKKKRIKTIKCEKTNNEKWITRKKDKNEKQIMKNEKNKS